MPELEIELFARINVHEFLLEQLLLGLFMTTSNPLKQWTDFSAGIIYLTSLNTTTKYGTPESHEERRCMIEITERFCERVATRIEQGPGPS